MKFIYYLNNTVFGLTLLGYLTIFLGMYMQIALGIIQVILFFILLFNYDKFSERLKRHLSIYGVLTTIFLLLFFGVLNYTEDILANSIFLTIILYMLIPMCLGTYFTYIVYQLKKQVV